MFVCMCASMYLCMDVWSKPRTPVIRDPRGKAKLIWFFRYEMHVRAFEPPMRIALLIHVAHYTAGSVGADIVSSSLAY